MEASSPLQNPSIQKAYKNLEFLTSHDARTLRILSEYLEPASRFKKFKIDNTIVFFGSARTHDRATAESNLKAIQQKIKSMGNKVDPSLKLKLKAAQGVLKLAPFYEAAEELSFRLAVWGKSQKNKALKLFIASGGGDGMMKAANAGANRAKAPSIGLNISLPMEQSPNPFITPELAFEFHYFFMRKFWFMYLAKALVIFPGGFGTLDEFMEALTLIQTRKIEKVLPIVLFGKQYWNSVIKFEAMMEWGVIAPEDLDLIHITDSVDDAFSYITRALTDNVYKNSYYKKFVPKEEQGQTGV